MGTSPTRTFRSDNNGSPPSLIQRLLETPEGKTLEFKRDTTSPKGLLKTLVAFANTAGGRLVIGVAPDGSLHGINDPLSEEERLCNLVSDSIAPRLIPNIELVTYDNKTLLLIEVFPGNSRPHFLRADGPETGVFVRLGSTNRQADRELVAELRRSAEGVSFDELPMPGLSRSDLNLAPLSSLLPQKKSSQLQALQTLKLLRREQGSLVPTKGAVLLCGKERMRFFPDAWVQCGRFRGTDKTHIFDHIEIDEPLPQAVESVMLFLKKHAVRSADLSSIRRKDVWSIPLGILREVVINALVHADYSQRGAPIRVAFFDDRIEVENPGILLPGMTVEDMRQGVSKIRNPVIARVFRELGLIEQWGSGVRRIFAEAESQGLPPPVITEIGIRLRFAVAFKSESPISLHSTQSPTQLTTQLTTQSGDGFGTFLEVLRNGPKSPGQIRSVLKLKHRASFRQNYLRPAVESGLIEPTIPEKPTSRLQKYRLTPKGSAALSRVKNS
ncbi:MAG: ATP-binding protein [Verrucomicrobiota bacterium]